MTRPAPPNAGRHAWGPSGRLAPGQRAVCQRCGAVREVGQRWGAERFRLPGWPSWTGSLPPCRPFEGPAPS